MTIDRELLEGAALAAGIRISSWAKTPSQDTDFPLIRVGLGEYQGWSPLADDGDALRLAVKLRLNLSVGDFSALAGSEDHGVIEQVQFDNTGESAATRRAIVRAAYEIGKSMNKGD